MSILISQISYFGSQGEGTEFILNDWIKLTIKRGLDATANTIDIHLKNSINKRLSDGTTIHRYVNDNKVLSLDNETELAQGDVIKIWLRWVDSASDTITYDDTSANLITISEVKEWQGVLEDSKTPLILKCVDKTYEVLNKLWASSYTSSTALTCPTMAQRVIQNATDGIGNVKGFDSSGNFTKPALYSVDARPMGGTYAQQKVLAAAATGSPPAYIESLRIDESSYPVITMAKVWKPVYEWLREINSITNTNTPTEVTNRTVKQDRNNKFYIDQNNRYHQFYPSDIVNYTIVQGEESDDGTVSSFKLTKKTFDIINMVIYNAGRDLDNVGILWYYYDDASKERRLKMKYIPMLDVASEGNGSLRQAEVTEGNISVAADGIVTIDVSAGTTSWGVAYANDAAYKTEFREYAKSQANGRAIALTRNRGNPRWKGNISLKKGGNYEAGQLTKFTALSHGINLQLLRIKDITHQITPSHWSSILDVEEDEPKFGETV